MFVDYASMYVIKYNSIACSTFRLRIFSLLMKHNYMIRYVSYLYNFYKSDEYGDFDDVSIFFKSAAEANLLRSGTVPVLLKKCTYVCK